jgi:hypothetical protein
MKRIIVTLFLLLITYISSAQSGWGYVNYTSYKTHAGYGAQNQYAAFPYTKAEFDNMLNTANSNTTITHTGEVPFLWVYNGSTQTPHWGGDYYAIVFEYWFIPQETGTYRFAITSDDASDFSIDGTTLITYYGGHGAGQWIYGQKQLIAGQRYKIIARYQEFGGGDALYVRWARPSNPNYYFYWNNEVTNIGSVPTKQAKMNFDFGSTLDKTKFNIGSALGSTGWVDVTNQLDSNKVANGSKATIIGGGVEWSYVNPNASWLGGNSRLLIDMRKFGNTSPTDVKSVKILDVYEGPVTYTSHDPNGWAIYTVPSPLTKVTNGTSTYNQYIRNVNGWNTDYAFACDVSFGSVMQYKPQSVTITTTNNLTTLYNSIVTVSDVYLAFKELQNGGIFGNEIGNEFTYGIQYKNADVNDDGYFNETDSYLLLQHLTGKKNLVDTFSLNKTLKLITSSTYDSVGKSNWATYPTFLKDTFAFDINTDKSIDTFYLKGTWKGDVNLSHSATPSANGIANMSANFSERIKSMGVSTNQMGAELISELGGDSVYVYITFKPGDNNIVGTQFQINYDNSLLKFNKTEYVTNGSPTNYSADKGTFVNVGSLNTDGSQITSATYKVIFITKQKLNGVLGLISVGNSEAVDKTGKSLGVKIF